MVNPKGNADKLPQEWKDQVAAVSGKYLHGSEAIALYQDIVQLLDRCVTEAVLLNTAQLLDDTEAADMLTKIQERP